MTICGLRISELAELFLNYLVPQYIYWTYGKFRSWNQSDGKVPPCSRLQSSVLQLALASTEKQKEQSSPVSVPNVNSFYDCKPSSAEAGSGSKAMMRTGFVIWVWRGSVAILFELFEHCENFLCPNLRSPFVKKCFAVCGCNTNQL